MYHDAITRFFAKTMVDESTGCWNWCGAITAGGYGNCWVQYKMVAAHRVIYELFHGPIPEGLQVDHLCRNRRCVRPSHLEAVTGSTNTLRGDLYNRRKTHCPSGHAYDADNVYLNPDGSRKCRICQLARATSYQRTPAGRLVSRAATRRYLAKKRLKNL